MKQIKLFFYFLFFSILVISCASKSENSNNSKSSYSEYSDDDNENNEDESSQNSESDDSEELSENEPICKFEDGTYSATVNYNNSATGYSATYTLDVEVQDCQVVQINFPNDGYLDEDHISYGDIDADGNASIDGEDGKTYEIRIEE